MKPVKDFAIQFSFQFLETNLNLLIIHVIDAKCDSIRFRDFFQYTCISFISCSSSEY